MKGPGLRLTCDVRRLWQCPQCQRFKKTAHDATSCRCSCQSVGVWMKLIDKAPPIAPYPFTPQEVECLIFRPIQPSRPDAEMAEMLHDPSRQRSGPNRSRPRDLDRGSDSRGPRGGDRGPFNEPRRDQPQETPNPQLEAPQEAPVTATADALTASDVASPEPISAAPTNPSSAAEPHVTDEFGVGVE